MYKAEKKIREMKQEVRNAKRKRFARRAKLHLEKYPDGSGEASDGANAASEKTKRGWLSRFFGKENISVLEGQPSSNSVINDVKPQVSQTNEDRVEETRWKRPSTMGSNLTTQVAPSATPSGFTTPISRGANTPNPGMALRGGGGDPAHWV